MSEQHHPANRLLTVSHEETNAAPQRRRWRDVAVAVACLLVLAAPAARAYEAQRVEDGGTISGVVRFAGDPPQLPAIKVLKNADYCGEEMRDPVLVVNRAGRGVKNTVVYLENIERGKPIAAAAKVESIKCLFEPHVQPVFTDTGVLLRNQDPVLHNPHAFTLRGATIWNVALTQKGQSVTKPIRSTGVIRLQCDAHLHMNAWLIALDHPYAAVTDENGRFSITDVPPGRYRLIAWHEGFSIANRSAHEASLAERTEDAERPVYDEPYVLSTQIEVKPRARVTADFELRGR